MAVILASAFKWLAQAIPWLAFEAEVVAVSEDGMPGLMAASRTSDCKSPGRNLAIGCAAVVINDRLDAPSAGYAFYAEGRRLPGVKGPTTTVEFEAINNDPTPNPPATPFDPVVPGITAALWLGIGGSLPYAGSTDDMLPVYPADMFAGMLPNGAQAHTGIVVSNDALVRDARGMAPFARLGDNHTIEWWVPGGRAMELNGNDWGMNVWASGACAFNVSAGMPGPNATSIAVLINDGQYRFEQVLLGPPNSGGPGFRALVVAN